MHRECWHTWATLKAEAFKEWFSWVGAFLCAGGLIAIWFFTAEQLLEFGGRVTAMGGIVAGVLLILKRARKPEGDE